jgi:hypothetical protein
MRFEMAESSPTAVHEQPGGGDRVRANTPDPRNDRIDAESVQCLETLSSVDAETVARHVDALDREWDVERYLQTNAGLLALSGAALAATVDRRFLVLPGVVFAFLFQHAVQGWCPPLPVFRALGVRTRREINREKYALKALRGDFDAVPVR